MAPVAEIRGPAIARRSGFTRGGGPDDEERKRRTERGFRARAGVGATVHWRDVRRVAIREARPERRSATIGKLCATPIQPLSRSVPVSAATRVSSRGPPAGFCGHALAAPARRALEHQDVHVALGLAADGGRRTDTQAKPLRLLRARLPAKWKPSARSCRRWASLAGVAGGTSAVRTTSLSESSVAGTSRVVTSVAAAGRLVGEEAQVHAERARAVGGGVGVARRIAVRAEHGRRPRRGDAVHTTAQSLEAGPPPGTTAAAVVQKRGESQHAVDPRTARHSVAVADLVSMRQTDADAHDVAGHAGDGCWRRVSALAPAAHVDRHCSTAKRRQSPGIPLRARTPRSTN